MDCFEGDECMKRFTKILLGAIFVALIAGSIQSISADHETDKGIFKDRTNVDLADTKNTNYQVYLQAVLRDGDGHLISIIESTANAGHISHKLTDDIFDTLMGKKEIIIIDNIKYEKVQYTHTPTLEKTTWGDTQGRQVIFMCETIEGHGDRCIPIFQILVSTMTLEPQGVVTHQWTVLRALN